MENRNTLLQINTVVNFGSTGRIAEDIGVMAINHGWRSYIAYGRFGRNSQSELVDINSILGFHTHVFQTRLFDRHGLGSKKSTEKLVALIKQLKPNLIHLHNLHGYYLNIEVLFSFLSIADIPVVWTFHDCWPITGHCVYFDFVKCDKWKHECGSCIQKHRYPASYWFDRSTDNFRLKRKLFNSVKNLTIVTVSNWLAGVVRQSFLANVPLVTINNGIDTTVFKRVISHNVRKKYNLEDKFVILGVASSWDYRKGLDDFIELSRYLDGNCAIILIGLNKQQLNRIPNNILGLSRTDNIEELVDFYNIADVFFNSSLEETFGLTTIEAMACGTPSIVYNNTACPEALSDDTGFIVDKKDLSGVIQAIETVRKRSKDYYSNACIQRVGDLYDKNERYLDYLELYNSIIS